MYLDPSQVSSGSIVAGVDGSAHADDAIRWAARQAGCAHRPLTLLHSVGSSGRLSGHRTGPTERHEEVLVRGRSLLDAAARLAGRCEPGLDVRRVLGVTDPATDLLDAARLAGMLVVGSRGAGPVRSLLLGSTGAAVCPAATCPVVVARPEDRDVKRGILVGVDGAPESLPVIEFAFRQASLTRRPLTAMHAFWDVAGSRVHGRRVAPEEPGLEDQRLALATSVAAMSEKFPDVDIRLELLRGLVDRSFREAGTAMDLVVVGRHHHGRMARLVTGSMATAVLEQVSCSVAMVPVTDSPAVAQEAEGRA